MFVHINKKASFTDELKSKYVNSIVFIKDTQEIWTHNTFYAIPEKYKNKISELEQKVDDALIFLTQEEYDLLGTDIKKDAIYIITNDTPELKVQGPLILDQNDLLKEVDTIEDNNHYVFKVNNDYFFIYKDEFDISLPNDPSSYKQITGNFEILNTEQGKYEYCVPEVVDIESLDDIGMENLLRDTVIVDSFESYGSVAMNYSSRGFYSQPNSEYGRFYGFYVDSASYNISLNSDKSLTRYSQAGSNTFTYNFPDYLCTYQIDSTNILIQKCLNRDNYSFYHYAQEQFNRFKTDFNIEEVELIRKSNTIYDRELTAIGKKINLDLNNRLDFGVDSNIIVGKIVNFKYKEIFLYYYEGKSYNEEAQDSELDVLTNRVNWYKLNNNYLVIVTRSDKIVPEPLSAVKLRRKDDLTTLKYDGTNYFNEISFEKIEEFKDKDVSEFLSNIIVPAVAGVNEAVEYNLTSNFATNPWYDESLFLNQDDNIQSSNIFTGLKIGKGNPDFTNTYEYRFSEYRSTFIGQSGKQYNLYYSPFQVPGDHECRGYEYTMDGIMESNVSEVISEGKYKTLAYNTNIGFNCPSYIIPSLYYYLHLGIKGYTNTVIDSIELIAPSNYKFDFYIKNIERYWHVDLYNRFSYDENPVSNYMILYIKTKEMN